MKQKCIWIALALAPLAASAVHAAEGPGRWSEESANVWGQKTLWLVGCNFTPSTAINQLEMWQADTFDLATIDRELGWAEQLGFNSIRVYLHNLLWEQDAQGFLGRMEQFLEIADRHRIGVMFVLLDGCWDPFPKLGKQRAPKPHVHNSGWVQSPGVEILKDPARHDELKGYVKGVVSHFRNDRRVHAWDIFNEPDNANQISYGKHEPPNKAEMVLPLLAKAFAWAREANPSQPITACVWLGDWSSPEKLSPINRFMLEQSDVITFHCYSNLDEIKRRVKWLQRWNRPILCTEYMSRPVGSTFEAILPYLKDQNVGAYNWGLVAGKTQTVYPWDSWTKTYTAEPPVWFHDILRPDGTPFDPKEADRIRELIGRSESPPVARPIRAKPISGKAAPLPTAQKQPIVWRYMTERPSGKWYLPEFDDLAWNEGPAGFGTEGTPGAVIRTRWSTSDIWLRRVFHLDNVPQTDLAWLIHFDEDAEVYVNGIAAARFPRWVGDYTLYNMDPAAQAALKPGRNAIAVHCHQTYGGQYIDVGIVAVEAPDLPALPPIEPLFDYPVRDTCICLGPDGWYYLTGTTGHPTWWQTNEGIRVWKSKDLKTWEPLGLVWSIEKDGAWQKKVVIGRRAIWAPEIHYIKGTFWLAYCVNYGGTGLLKSTSGKAEGPYVDVKPDGPLTNEIDASLFQDDDGTVYFVYQDGKIAQMKEDMSGLAETPRLLKPANADHVGFEGAFIFKAGGRYCLSCAEFNGQFYDCMIAAADNLMGPYGDCYLAIPHGGHNMFFRDRDGRWWSTFFGNDPAAPFRERPAILRVRFDKNAKVRPEPAAVHAP